MSTSWQLSIGADLEWQYQRLEKLHHNVGCNAEKIRLILKEFEVWVNDSILELKYVSEAQIRLAAPQVEGKLLEANKLFKTIQQLLEQNMVLQTTELRYQSDASVHSHQTSTATPVGVYTPAHTPNTGVMSYADSDSNIGLFQQTHRRMESFPQNISNIMNSAFNLQTPHRMVHNGENTEDQNAENNQSLSSKSIPRYNLSFTENDESFYSPEYAASKFVQSGTVELPSRSIENSYDNINRNESNDACIEIPEEVFSNSTICKDLSHEYESSNNTVMSDEFFTPKSEINQEKSIKEMVIDIDTKYCHSDDHQGGGCNKSDLKKMNQADHTLSSKRKRVSTCNTPIKSNESKTDDLTASDCVAATINMHVHAERDQLYNASLDDGLSTYHVESESLNQNMTQKENILTNLQVVIDNGKLPQNADYGNECVQTVSVERPIEQMEETETELILQKLPKEVFKKDCQDPSITTETIEDNTEIRHQRMLVENCGGQEDGLLHSTETLKQKVNGYSLMTDAEIKLDYTSTLQKETVINCENIMYDISNIPLSDLPLEQYIKVYVTHFEAPNRVWIQLEDCGIENFQYEINSAVSHNCDHVPEDLICLDSLVIAPYGASNEFYRAQVNSITKGIEEPIVRVNFLDYGNSETIKISSLVMMSESVMKVPSKAIKCILEKVNGTDLSSWSSFDLLFSQLVNNTPFYAYIKDYEKVPMNRTLEYEENEPSGLKPRYIIILSEQLVNEEVKPCMESSIADSTNEAELDLPNGMSSSSSTNYLSYHGIENEVYLNEESIKQPEMLNSSEDCEIPKQKHDVNHTDELTEDSQKPESNISENEICVQKMATIEISHIGEIKDLSEMSKDDVHPNESASEDEKACNTLQELCSIENSANKKVDKRQTRRRTRKCVNTSNFNSIKKSEYKMGSENRTVSENVKEPEANENAYFGKWSSLTNSTEYTLNAAGKVVNFNSNESWTVKHGNDNTQPQSNSIQKSCRKRQMSSNATTSKNTLQTISEFNAQSEEWTLVDRRIRRKSHERQPSEKQQQDNINNEIKSTHFSLPHPAGKKYPTSNSSANSDTTAGSDSECYLPVEVLPDVKLEKQQISCGAEKQIEVLVSHVDTPNSFFLHLVNSETASIDRLNENMTEHYKNDYDYLKVERLPVGSFWAVRKDNCWYRAQILASLPRKAKTELHLEVRFVDHGDTDIVSIKDVRVLAESFTFVPILALHCSLAQVSPQNEWEDNPWTQQSLKGFVDLIGNFSSVLLANFIRYTLIDHYDVVLENEYGVINEMMVNKGFAKGNNLQNIGKGIFPGFINEDADCMTTNVSNSTTVDPLSRWDPRIEAYSNGYSFQNDECAETLISGRKNTDLTRLCKFFRIDGKCPRGVTCRFEHKLENKAHTIEKEAVFVKLYEDQILPKENSVVVMIVTHIVSPRMFYCYLPFGLKELPFNSEDPDIDSSNKDRGLPGLLKSMCDYYRHSLPTPNRALPAVGELRAAPNNEEWWRVRVIECKNNELDEIDVKVYFLDIGEDKWVKEIELRPLDIQFLHLPAQALECWLYDVPWPPNGWASAAKNHFKDLTNDRYLVGLILHCDESNQRLGVKLFDTSDEEININDAMINQYKN